MAKRKILTDLMVNGSVMVSDDSSNPTASNVGSIRYREDSNGSYVDMCMRVSAIRYRWINIVQNNY